MKYLEEIEPGDCFNIGDTIYILTTDFKKSGDRLCYKLHNGTPQWISSNQIVDINPIYTLDKDNNISPIKIEKKQDVVA